MSNEHKIPESSLHQLWLKQNYKSSLHTHTGDDIAILDAGTLNDSTGGPDFKNARVRIGNLTFVGDIEIDRDYSDWKTHGHNIDNKYNSVILHAALFNKNNHAYVYTRNGRKVPSVCLSNFIDIHLTQSIQQDSDNEKEQIPGKIKCIDLNANVTVETKEKYLSNLGIERFHKKCKKVYERLKELEFLRQLKIKEPVIAYELTTQFHEKQFDHSDFANKEIWQQLFYELIFEALGYSKNKTPMTNLAQSANINFLKQIASDGVLIEKYEAALLYISGIIDSQKKITDAQSKEYTEKIILHWNAIKPFYDGKFLEAEQWHFFRMRPQNFPTIRLAAGARILKELLYGNLINIIAKKINEIHNPAVLINSLRSLFVIKSDGFWRTHYVLDQTANGDVKYFVGASRADEIVVNVLLPYFSVYFDMFGNQNAAKKILKVYTLFEQKSENQIITDVGNALNMGSSLNKTVVAQGIIDLFRNYCSKNKCLECEIGKSVFN